MHVLIYSDFISFKFVLSGRPLYTRAISSVVAYSVLAVSRGSVISYLDYWLDHSLFWFSVWSVVPRRYLGFNMTLQNQKNNYSVWFLHSSLWLSREDCKVWINQRLQLSSSVKSCTLRPFWESNEQTVISQTGQLADAAFTSSYLLLCVFWHTASK